MRLGTDDRKATPLCLPPTAETDWERVGTGAPGYKASPALWNRSSSEHFRLPGEVRWDSLTAYTVLLPVGSSARMWLLPSKPVGLMHPITGPMSGTVLGPGCLASPSLNIQIKKNKNHQMRLWPKMGGRIRGGDSHSPVLGRFANSCSILAIWASSLESNIPFSAWCC